VPRPWPIPRPRLQTVLLAAILATGAALRFYGLNWDGGHWLHPDERQIYFIALGLRWPDSLAQAFSPASPLNPRFFAYGSLPIYLLRLFAALLSPLWPAVRDLANLHLAGRTLSALLDTGTIYLTYRLARHYLAPRAALLAAALAATALLPIQFAHFYTPEPLLTFLVLLALSLAAATAGRRRGIALGLVIGLALATKVSAAPLLLLPLATYARRPTFRTLLSRAAPVYLVAALAFFLAQPYALVDWPTFAADTLRESQIATGRLDVPYTLQYAGTLPLLYTLWQTALWGLSLPFGLVAWAGLAALLIRWLLHGARPDALLLSFAGPYLAITGLLYARPLRYVLPLVPILSILALSLFTHHRTPQSTNPQSHSTNLPLPKPPIPNLPIYLSTLLLLCTLAYTLTFATIYGQPHPWISASTWLYRQAPARATLATEHWDTPLPLPLELDGRARRSSEYDLRTLPLYDEPDDGAKWQAIAADLAASDYLIVASRRLYGSLSRLPDRYPLAAHYHQRLFAGDLGFEPAAEFTRGPTWLNPPVPPLAATAALWIPDETFVVYDHPRALIFRNTGHLSAEQILRRLSAP
jgi:hypothetical protein